MLVSIFCASFLSVCKAGNLRLGRQPVDITSAPSATINAASILQPSLLHPFSVSTLTRHLTSSPLDIDSPCTATGLLPKQRADFITYTNTSAGCFASCQGASSCNAAAFLPSSGTCLAYRNVRSLLVNNEEAILFPVPCADVQQHGVASRQLLPIPRVLPATRQQRRGLGGLIPTVAQITTCMLDPECLEAISSDLSALLPAPWQEAYDFMHEKLFTLSNKEGGLFSGDGLGLIKQSVGPDDQYGEPEVTCYREGMVCCVPKETVGNFDEFPPRLNGLDAVECLSRYTTLANQYCAAVPYLESDGNTCGVTVVETEEMLVYRHMLYMNEKYLNNAICSCGISKINEGDIIPYTAWEYVVQATAAAAEVEADDPDEPIGSTALAQTQLVGYTKSAAVNGGGELVPLVEPHAGAEWYEFISEVPSLSTAAAARRLEGVEKGEFGEGCQVPWPRSCKTWRPACETDPLLALTSACTPQDIIRDGCPAAPFSVNITHTSMGRVGFRVNRFAFGDSRSALLGCSFDIVHCNAASFEAQCGGISVGSRLLSLDWNRQADVRPVLARRGVRKTSRSRYGRNLLGRGSEADRFALVTVGNGQEVLMQRVQEENIIGKNVAFDVGKTASTFWKFTEDILQSAMPKESDPKSSVRKVAISGLSYVFKTEILRMGGNTGISL